jgi:riboflavin-specific deaminase-like protein
MPIPPSAVDSAQAEGLTARAWGLLRAAADAARRGIPLEHPDVSWFGDAFSVSPDAPPAVRSFLDLYAPVCAAGPERSFAIGQLGQSMDGHIATASGDSYFVTGPANVRHLHRLRALCSAVVVGAGTVASDDPRLTVRQVEGDNPVRVVLDPNARLDPRRRLFADGAARTLVVYAQDVSAPPPGAAEVLHVPVFGGRLRLDVLLRELHARGLKSVLVEGGGATVSSFLEAGLLDRLHLAIAPLITGDGRPGLNLAARDRIAECLHPAHRVFTMGDDVLFDCDLRATARPAAEAGHDVQRVL